MKTRYFNLFLFIFALNGCGSEKPEPFKILSPEQVALLSPGDKNCYMMAEIINNMHQDSPTNCSAIKEKETGLFKENYSFYFKTSTRKTAEWNKWTCLAVGKVMADGALVGMNKIYLKGDPKSKYASMIDAYVCRDLQQKAYIGEIKEFDVLKEFNRRSSVEEM